MTPIARLLVVRAGLLSTVQDGGRAGWGAFGVPAAGAMDALAARVANHLVGNAPDAPVLELTGPGAAISIDEPRLCALAGADLGAVIDDGAGGGRPLPPWQAVRLTPTETLRFRERRTGARAALAVDGGGFAVDRIFGSAATDVANRLGGWHGRPLRAGDCLPLGPASDRAPPPPRPPPTALIDAAYADPFQLRFIPAPDSPPAGAAWFSTSAFLVTPQSNRVGFRLRAEAPPRAVDAGAGALVSEPIAPGTLQLPPDGQPILLMAERQTIGGYPVAGHVIAADLSRAAQLWPGDQIRFVPVALAEARRALRAQADALSRWLQE